VSLRVSLATPTKGGQSEVLVPAPAVAADIEPGGVIASAARGLRFKVPAEETRMSERPIQNRLRGLSMNILLFSCSIAVVCECLQAAGSGWAPHGLHIAPYMRAPYVRLTTTGAQWSAAREFRRIVSKGFSRSRQVIGASASCTRCSGVFKLGQATSSPRLRGRLPRT
jgi:hypothetical protein